MKGIICLVLFAFVALVNSSDVTVLTPDNFDTIVGGGVPVFIKFYAPWCGHCKALAPTWEELATTFKSSNVKIAEVDADAHKELASRFDVHGYPTLKYFDAQSKTGEAYSGGRDLADLIGFVNQKIGTNVKPKKAPSAVVTLTPETFDGVVKDVTKNVIVAFKASWCGHCKALAPKFEKAAQSFDGDDSIVFAELDADKYRDLGTKYQVSGFPTLKYFPKDNKEGLDYNAGREAEDFVKFVNENFGTERVLGGAFADTAGRIPELDALAERFVKEPDSRSTIAAEAHSIIETTDHKNKAHGKFYEVVMKKIIEKGTSFVTNESDRLKKMVASGSIASNKKKEFTIRLNILNKFL